MDTASNDIPRITVVGEASRWAPADHADVSFTVVRRATDSAEALAAAAAAYADLAAEIGAEVLVADLTDRADVHRVADRAAAPPPP